MMDSSIQGVKPDAEAIKAAKDRNEEVPGGRRCGAYSHLEWPELLRANNIPTVFKSTVKAPDWAFISLVRVESYLR